MKEHCPIPSESSFGVWERFLFYPWNLSRRSTKYQKDVHPPPFFSSFQFHKETTLTRSPGRGEVISGPMFVHLKLAVINALCKSNSDYKGTQSLIHVIQRKPSIRRLCHCSDLQTISHIFRQDNSPVDCIVERWGDTCDSQTVVSLNLNRAKRQKNFVWKGESEGKLLLYIINGNVWQ